MTTKVTVDAHAGWPVLVTLKHGEPTAPKSISTQTVKPGTAHDFYIHSGLQIINIEEQVLPMSERLAVPFGAVD